MNLAHHSVNEGGPLVYWPMLGRGRGCGGVAAVGLVPQVIHRKTGTLANQGVAHLLQEGLVARVVVILPQMGS